MSFILVAKALGAVSKAALPVRVISSLSSFRSSSRLSGISASAETSAETAPEPTSIAPAPALAASVPDSVAATAGVNEIQNEALNRVVSCEL